MCDYIKTDIIVVDNRANNKIIAQETYSMTNETTLFGGMSQQDCALYP